MNKPKSATAVMVTLKKELEAENPSQVLERVQALKAIAIANGQGPLGITLTMARATTRYNHALIGVVDLKDWHRVQGMVQHFLQEVLGPEIKRLEIEVEVQRRLSEELKSRP